MSGANDVEFAPHLPDVEPRFRLRPMSQVQPRPVSWLIPGMVPLRTLTLVAGVGGLGKTTWLLTQAAAGSRAAEPWDTIYVSYEDTAAEIIRPRLEAAQANLERVHELVTSRDDMLALTLPEDILDLRDLVAEVQARLVVIDPIVAAIGEQFDTHKDQHVRIVLGQLAQLAEDLDCAVALVGHLNKAPSTDAYIRVANSVAFWNACRSVVLVTEDGDDDASRLVVQRKANWARLAPPERHRVEEVLLRDSIDPATGSPIVTARMVFVEHADDVDGAGVLGPQKTTKTESVETLLEALLADGEWHESAGVKQLLRAAGFNDRLAQRAAKDLNVAIESRGFPRSTWWRLPVATNTTPTDVATAETAQASGTERLAASSRDISMGDANGVATDRERARLFDELYPRKATGSA